MRQEKLAPLVLSSPVPPGADQAGRKADIGAAKVSHPCDKIGHSCHRTGQDWPRSTLKCAEFSAFLFSAIQSSLRNDLAGRWRRCWGLSSYSPSFPPSSRLPAHPRLPAYPPVIPAEAGIQTPAAPSSCPVSQTGHRNAQDRSLHSVTPPVRPPASGIIPPTIPCSTQPTSLTPRDRSQP